MLPTIVRTERLILRPFEPGDAQPMHAILSDADAMRYWSTLPHADLAQTERWIGESIRSVAAGESDDFVVVHEGRVVGKAGLWKGNELGMLFARSTWGTGIAREAVQAVIDRGRERGLKSITADVDPRNVRAVRFLEKFGFVKTGEAKQTYNIGGLWTDSVYLELALAASSGSSGS
jgi:RimJ/RimL family protein N-acetyltransferase